jgi:PAS domain S-box-containing protein
VTDERVSLLLVDDVDENLFALEAILEPLGQDLVRARSGEEALRALLEQEFACILLDVQMPGLDGFETAELIKRRERTKHIPIIFLTAISKDEQHVFRGYTAGAVDYMFKPFEPEVLRSKVGVFIELHRKNAELQRQGELLRERELAEERRVSEERYRQLADAMPQIVWTSDRSGKATYYNRRWFEYTGMSPDEADEEAWLRVVHPDDVARAIERRTDTLSTGAVFEVEYRFRAGDGSYRWHLGRAIPTRNEAGEIEFWIGTATDIHDHKRIEEAQQFLLEAGGLLASSLDSFSSLRAVARAAVPRVADWCAVHLVEDGELRELALVHVDPQKILFAEELTSRYPDGPSSHPAQRVLETGTSELRRDIADSTLEAVAQDDLHLGLLRELGLRSYMCVPLAVRDTVLGAITFVTAESGRAYDDADLGFAEELARRAATAVENARLYEQAEEQARAARVLGAVGDAVVLVDNTGVVRLWNRAAEQITGVPTGDVLGRPIADVVHAWPEIEPRIPVTDDPGESAARAETMPVEVGGREIWVSGSGVRVEEGTVYAFRDLTEERALEQMKSDFVATVSHELRTPLAAIYGAALTVRREDLELDADMQSHLLSVIAEESARLAQIVEDLLLASHLDSGRLHVSLEECDAHELTRGVIEAAETHLPQNVSLELDVAEGLPRVQADPEQLRQVISNLVDNAIKYSPGGGPVRVRLGPENGMVRLAVSDTGLGIPHHEQRRIFEKFYRLDPDMTRGIGGTGLGLYIVRELVRRFDGRIWVESAEGKGSTFFVELRAGAGSRPQRSPAAASA